MNILFASESEDPQRWLPRLKEHLPGDGFFLEPGAQIEVALVAKPPAGTFENSPNLKFVQSLWMGVEQLLADPALPRGVPIARLVDPGMVLAMSETVLARVLEWHRHHPHYRSQQRERLWKPLPQFMAADRRIGLLGLGELGSDAARKLVALGFSVRGWGRRPKRLDGVECSTELPHVLAQSDVVVCLLPLTAATRGLLSAQVFAQMPEGACLINVARGGHVVEKDLLAALDSGRVSHAYLDVFETEPLPADHPFWAHPKVTLTPHVAALTEPRTSIPKIVANLERVRRGERPEGLVDPAAGY